MNYVTPGCAGCPALIGPANDRAHPQYSGRKRRASVRTGQMDYKRSTMPYDGCRTGFYVSRAAVLAQRQDDACALTRTFMRPKPMRTAAPCSSLPARLKTCALPAGFCNQLHTRDAEPAPAWPTVFEISVLALSYATAWVTKHIITVCLKSAILHGRPKTIQHRYAACRSWPGWLWAVVVTGIEQNLSRNETRFQDQTRVYAIRPGGENAV